MVESALEFKGSVFWSCLAWAFILALPYVLLCAYLADVIDVNY